MPSGATTQAPSGQPQTRFQVEDSGVLCSPSSGLGFPLVTTSPHFANARGRMARPQLRLPPPPGPGAQGSPSPRGRSAPPAPSHPRPPAAGRPTHHPPHLGRYVVAELPFDRGLSRLAGHGGPGHLHARPGARPPGRLTQSAARAGPAAGVVGPGRWLPWPRRALLGGVEEGAAAQLGSAGCGERRAGREGCGRANLRHAGSSPPRGHPQPQEAVAGRARVCVRARAAATSPSVDL